MFMKTITVHGKTSAQFAALGIFAVGLVFMPGFVYAEDDSSVSGGTANTGVFAPPAKPEIRKEARVEVRKEIKENRKEFRGTLDDVRASTTAAKIEIRNEFRTEVREIRHSSSTGSSTGYMIREAAQERTEAWKEFRSNANVQIAATYALRVYNRLSIAVERLNIIAERLEARIEKIQDMGGTTADAVEYLASARVHIAAAQAAAEGFAEWLQTMPEDTLPDVIRAKAQAAADTIKTELNATQQDLKNALEYLKANNTQASLGVSAAANTAAAGNAR